MRFEQWTLKVEETTQTAWRQCDNASLYHSSQINKRAISASPWHASVPEVATMLIPDRNLDWYLLLLTKEKSIHLNHN